MSHPHESRQRKSDMDAKAEIQRLIQDESDPRERARLLILLQLNNTLVDHVCATRELTTEFREHREEFVEHVHKEERRQSWGQGALWSAIALLAVIEGLIMYIAGGALNTVNETAKTTNENRAKIAAHAEHHRTEERILGARK